MSGNRLGKARWRHLALLQLLVVSLLVSPFSFPLSKANAATEPQLVALSSTDYLDFTSVSSGSTNPSLESGDPLSYQAGNVYRYANVYDKNGVAVDALVTIESIDSTATLNLLDDDTTDTSAAIVRRFNPTVSTSGGAGAVHFRIDFVEHGTSNAVYLKNFYLTAIDLDGNSSASEYAELAGFSSYQIGNPASSNSGYRSKLTIASNSTTGRTQFKGISGSLSGVQFEDTAALIASYAAPVHSIQAVIGNTDTLSNGGGKGRQFSLNFGAPGGTFHDPATFYNEDSPTITVAIEDGGDDTLSSSELNSVVIQGTTTKAAPGDQVTITVEDTSGKTLTFNTTVDGDGGYAKTVDLSSFGAGTITATASVVNAHGNPSNPNTDTSTIAANVAPTAANVEVGGTKEVGQTLTGDYDFADADGDLEGTSTYAWYVGSESDGSDKTVVSGETGTTYTPAAGDEGKYVFFEVTPVAATGVTTGTPVTSVGYGPIAAANVAPTATNVEVGGTKEVGQTLTGDYDFADADGDLEGTSTYAWYVGGESDGSDKTVVSGETGTTYTPAAGDAGKYVFFEVTPVATAGVTTGSPVMSGGYGPIAAANVAPTATDVEVSGTKEVGQTLTGDYDFADADGDLEGTSTYAWYVGGESDGSDKTVVSGETGTTYTPAAGDEGKYVFFEVTPVAATGVTTGTPVTSVGYGPIAAANVAPTAANVEVGGTKEVGQTLTGDYDFADADGDLEGTSTYAWYVGGESDGSDKTVVSGETGTTYTPAAGDAGKYVFFEVTPVATAGVTTGSPVMSGGYGPIAAANVAPTAANVEVGGTKEVGQTLTGDYDFADADGDLEGASTYAWYVGGESDGSDKTVVSGETGTTYVPAAGDAGKYVFFEVTPVAATGVTTGTPAISGGYGPIAAANVAPTATDVSIDADGSVLIGDSLQGTYHYADADSDNEAASAYKWYRGDKADGSDKVAIAGATTKEYSLAADDVGKYIFFEVTPVAATGVTTGAPAVSSGLGPVGAIIYDIALTATPDRIIGNGTSTSLLAAAVKDEDGHLVPNVRVRFSNTRGDFVDADGQVLADPSVVTDENGRAEILYRSASLLGTTTPVSVQIQAEVNDSDHGLQGQAQIEMWLEPAVIAGVITNTDPGTGEAVPVAGATVVIKDSDGTVIGTVQTGEDGSYSVPITDGNKTYTAEITRTIGTGDKARSITYKQKVEVDEAITGAGQVFESSQTIAGVIGGKDEDGTLQPIEFGSIVDPSAELNSGFRAYLKKPDGTYVNASGYSIEADGLFLADGLPADPSIVYQLEIRYEYDAKLPDGTTERQSVTINKKKDGSFPELTVGRQGEMNINEELIDPFGVITDVSTGLPIADVHVTLTYSDTVRNRSKGIVPGTEVVLPGLPGFLPSDNANPQNSDADGNYAYMVYGDTDYTIVATHAGYATYVSPNIAVNADIVRWDFGMTPSGGTGPAIPTTPTTPTTPEAPKQADAVVNVAVDRSVYEENGKASIDVTYGNVGDAALTGTVTLTLPEGTTVLDAAGGTVSGNTVVWSVTDLKNGQKDAKTIQVQFPMAASGGEIVEMKAQLDAEGGLVSPANAASSVKVLLFSNRFGDVSHQRYILGLPDGNFHAQKSLTRGELAAIIARLINGGATDLKADYSDVSDNYWANGYIRIVTDNGIFSGYEDGTFRPNQAITRDELAVVMARYLKLETPAPLNVHFTDAAGRWSTAAIEALYRNGMLKGYVDGTFRPGDSITRLEAVVLVNRMLFRGPLSDTEQTFPDFGAAKWGFGDVEEATISHEASRNADGSESFIRSKEDNVQ